MYVLHFSLFCWFILQSGQMSHRGRVTFFIVRAMKWSWSVLTATLGSAWRSDDRFESCNHDRNDQTNADLVLIVSELQKKGAWPAAIESLMEGGVTWGGYWSRLAHCWLQQLTSWSLLCITTLGNQSKKFIRVQLPYKERTILKYIRYNYSIILMGMGAIAQL